MMNRDCGRGRRVWVGMAGAMALLCAGAGPAHADVKVGVDAWDRGDYDTAVAQWRAPANAGDPDAMFNMAQAYKLGRGVPKDMARAEDLFHRAAQKGHIRAADNYGILLFQTGRQTQAMPWLNASADRGEPRAMYILGIAAYNGDYAAQDPVRAYALMTRAAQAGLQQAVSSLAAMNEAIGLEQRQQGVALAQELDRRSQATRAREMGAADLGSTPAAVPANAALSPVELPPSQTGGADYGPPVAPPVAPAKAVSRPVRPAPVAAAHDGAGWRVQFGAFGQKANADALWAKLRTRPEVAGHARIDLGSGITRLMAGGYSENGAKAACAALKADGFTCIVVNH